MSYTDYRLLDSLGEEGNGWVYLMRDNSNNEFAVKVSKINDEQVKKSKGDYTRLKLERFKTEATKVHELYKNGQKGIIPVETYELPCEKTGKYCFHIDSSYFNPFLYLCNIINLFLNAMLVIIKH